MDKVRKHFQRDAEIFDARILKSVPFYRDMLEALVSAIPFKRDQKIKVADLGCGTGTLSQLIKEHYPKASITCVDFADRMLEIAKKKLKDYSCIKYVACDCREFDLSVGYDAVVSSLTLHHIQDENQKKEFYKKIFNGLNDKGVLYTADLVLGADDYLQNLNLKKWRDSLALHFSRKEIKERRKTYNEEDHPFRFMDEIHWLEQAGFRNIDLIWKYYHFAVFGGQK